MRPSTQLAAVLVASALAVGGCSSPGGERDAGPDGGSDRRLFSFAILADLHLGDGHDDYGTPGYDDSGGEEDAVTAALRAAVGAVNRAAEREDVAFVVVLGDLTDSAEVSELERAREVLDGLDVPYFPLLGNHDVWPYTAAEEAPLPTGDLAFERVFGEVIERAGARFDGFARAPGPVPNPEVGGESLFACYAFGHQGRRFVALDLNSRAHVVGDEPGIGPEADLHDFEGGTLPWLGAELDRSASLGPDAVVAFAHHPPIVAVPVRFGLEVSEHERLGAFLREGGRGEALWGFFGGHHHIAYDTDDYGGRRIVAVGATKDGEPPTLVQVFADGRLDFETQL